MIVADLSSGSLAGESAGKAMSRIYGNIGFAGLWNGLPVRIVMIGTLTVHAHSLHYPFPCRHQSLPKRDEMLIPNYRLSNGLSTTVSRSPWVCPRQVATRQKFVSGLSTSSFQGKYDLGLFFAWCSIVLIKSLWAVFYYHDGMSLLRRLVIRA